MHIKSIALIIATLTCGVACGGKSQVEEPGASTGQIGPIDEAGLPAELPLSCAGPGTPPRLALPCKIGQSLMQSNTADSVNVVECYDLTGGTAISFTMPFGSLSHSLNQPLQIPFSSLPSLSYGSTVVDGMRYSGELHGTAIFSQIDPAGRAFVGTLSSARIDWNAGSTSFTCEVPTTPFWAIAGEFI